MHVHASQSMFCKSCDYQLVGLSNMRCPECGRDFDPADARTFSRTPRTTARRKWRIRLVWIAALAAVCFALSPRRFMRSSITFNCPRCQTATTMNRIEAVPPNWIHFRYPGLNWTSHRVSSADRESADKGCPAHAWSIRINGEMRYGSFSGSSSAQPGQTIQINGLPASPRSAGNILRALMSPANTGISIGPSSPPRKDDSRGPTPR